MKRQNIPLVLVVSLLATIPLLGQAQSSSDPIKLDPNAQRVDFVPNVILVRFKDELPINPQSVARLSKVGATSVDAIFQKYQVTSVAQLFKDAKPLQQKQMLKSFNGKTFERPSLHNIYKLNVKDPTQLFETIDALKSDPNVIYAEPNYIYSIVDDKPVSGVLTPADVKKLASEKTKTAFSPQSINVVTPNDPLYPQQWYIPAVHADAVWDSTQGDTSQVIAFLDTGVDWHHPDLADNIWTNTSEANGIAGVDDDGDGYVDDIHGWDFIHNDNDPSDDNSHGTHVAGIACAEGNNGIGIAGINWHAKIMPIKVFQSNGRGDAATISRGINYATMKGATVINMSFGSYARSLTMEAALQNALANCVLVAAAGNDGEDINILPFFPAALSYVLGVEAGDSPPPFGFSNWDSDGPVYSNYTELFDYEMKAPGVGIISTIPNGNYGVLSGTSMATPIVSGAVALYRQIYPSQSQELMWGNLINTTSNYLDIFAALTVHPNPSLWFVSNTMVDTLAGDNNNGRVDAGETIQLWFKVRNSWGQSDSVFVGLQLGEFKDTSVAHILNPTAFLGGISPYATITNETNPFSIQISPNVAQGRDIVFQAMLWYHGATDTTRQQIVLTTSNGQYLAGVLDSTLVLTPDRNWIVNNSFKIGSTGHLILKPGTQLLLKEYIINNGIISGIGTKDSVITISGQCIGGGGSLNLQYASFENMSVQYDYIGYNDYRSNDFSGPGTFLNCSFSNLDGFSCFGGTGPYSFDGCRFQHITGHFMFLMPSTFLDCAFDQIYANALFCISSYSILRCNFNSIGGSLFYSANASVKYCNFSNIKDYSIRLDSCNFSNSIQNPIYYSGSGDIDNEPNIYWGTTDSAKISKYYVNDFWDNPGLAMVKFTPFLTRPTDYAHGFVWKVNIDGVNPFDSTLNPIGAGSHRFDVYFNIPMDTTFTPQLTFGVRTPFNQQAVTDSTRWSPDHTIWTAYKTVKLYTGDGINTISVLGAKDLEGFDIPVENMRFQFLINAAGTSSVDFTATSGLGKINLEWNNTGLVDLLGFNMYRFTNVTDTTYSDTTLINKKLITDTLYTDFDVIPGKNYHYAYKVVRTDFSESDFSHIASAKALTSSPGDANGDLAVNVLDVVATVSDILGQNPQPFIFAAADVNHDSTINVLDLVGIINIILHPSGSVVATLSKSTNGGARLDLTGNAITLTSSAAVSAIQFKLQGKELKDLQFTPDPSIAQFEAASNALGDSARVFVIYNLKGSTLGNGTYTLGKFSVLPPLVGLTEGVVADAQGKNIVTSIYENGQPLIPQVYYLNQNFPNPFNMSTRIQFGVPAQTKVKIVLYNVLGQKVRTYDLGERTPGRYDITWDGMNERGKTVSSGIYFYRFESNKFTQTKKLVLIK